MNTVDSILVTAVKTKAAVGAFYNPPRVHLGWLGVALGILSLLPVP